MKKTLLVLALLVLTLAANAIPAKPGLKKTITLADGTQIVATLVGDEHGHFYRGSDGKAYQMKGETGIFEEADEDAIIAKAQTRKMKARKALYASTSDGMGQYGLTANGPVNSQGELTIPVIMVQFKDVTFKSTTTKEKMNRYYNLEGYNEESKCVGSVRDYFKSQSNGHFVPTFDVVGIVTLSKNRKEYGGNDSDDNDKDLESFVDEAIGLAQSSLGVDFTKYYKNGKVQLVSFLYAGEGEATGGPKESIWPCEFEWEHTVGNAKFDGFFVGNELDGTSLMGMGVFCHEFGHALGLPDFYCTDYSYENDDAMSNWSIMDTGAYVNDAQAPIGHNAYERSFLGWLDIPEAQEGQNITLQPYTKNGTHAVRINISSTETYILANHYTGTWYPTSMGSGLMLVRIAYNKNQWDNNTPNNTQSAQRIKMITADGAKLYYSGKQSNLYGNGKNEINPLNLLNGSTKSVVIKNITKNSDGSITFQYGDIVSNVKTPTFTPAAGRYAEAQQVTIACATTGAAIYYTTNGTEPTTSSTKYTGAFTVSETTTVKAVAYYDGEYSAVATAKYTISTGSQLLYEGLSSSTVTSDGTKELTTSSETLDYDGWSSFTKIYAGANAYAEGGCLKMGSSKVAGSMTANDIALEGNGTLTFYLKKYGSDTGKLNVTVTGATADVTEFTPTDNWTECVVKLTNGTGNVSITLATSSKRAYVEITLEAGSTSGGGGDTPQPTDEKQFDKVTAVDDGQMCVIAFNVNGTTHLMEAYSGTGTYGYLQASTTATENNGTILASNTKNYFIFEEGSNGFYLRDYAGNFYNSSDGYATFTIVNASASAPKNGMRKAPAAAQEWTVTSDASGNLTIKNNTTGKWLQYNTQYNSVGLYNTQQATGILPGAYAENTATGISSIENEELGNTHTDSAVYTLDGRKVSTLDAPVSTLPKGIYIIGGKKVVVR